MDAHIIFVLRGSGDFFPLHAIQLRDNVAQFVSDKVTFHLLTDFTESTAEDHQDDKDIWEDLQSRFVITPIKHSWPGWWSKIEMFRDDLPIPDNAPILYLDLDTVVTGDISHFFDGIYPGLTTLKGFRRDRLASGVMMWYYGQNHFIYHKMANGNARRTYALYRKQGDQGFIEDTIKDNKESVNYLQDIHPRQIVSYKNHVRKPKGEGLPKAKHKIVCFHGKPRPWEIDLSGWF